MHGARGAVWEGSANRQQAWWRSTFLFYSNPFSALSPAKFMVLKAASSQGVLSPCPEDCLEVLQISLGSQRTQIRESKLVLRRNQGQSRRKCVTEVLESLILAISGIWYIPILPSVFSFLLQLNQAEFL